MCSSDLPPARPPETMPHGNPQLLPLDHHPRLLYRAGLSSHLPRRGSKTAMDLRLMAVVLEREILAARTARRRAVRSPCAPSGRLHTPARLSVHLPALGLPQVRRAGSDPELAMATSLTARKNSKDPTFSCHGAHACASSLYVSTLLIWHRAASSETSVEFNKNIFQLACKVINI